MPKYPFEDSAWRHLFSFGLILFHFLLLQFLSFKIFSLRDPPRFHDAHDRFPTLVSPSWFPIRHCGFHVDMNMDAKDRSPATSADRNASEDIDEIADRATGNGGGNSAGPTGNGNGPKKSSSKDPSRPRRKKARRACFACQRAHLTCGTLILFITTTPSHSHVRIRRAYIIVHTGKAG